MSFARYEKFAKKQAETAKLMKEFKIQNEENRMGRQLQDSERARMFAPITKELGELKTGLTTEIADPSDPTKMIRVPKQQLLTGVSGVSGVSGVTPSGAPLAITQGLGEEMTQANIEELPFEVTEIPATEDSPAIIDVKPTEETLIRMLTQNAGNPNESDLNMATGAWEEKFIIDMDDLRNGFLTSEINKANRLI